MSVTPDPDWDALTEDWKTEPADTPAISVADLHEKVHRQNRRLVLTVILEILITITMIFYGLFELSRTGMHAIIEVGALWTFVLVVWLFSIWNRRGVWQSQAQTTQAHLDLLYTRARRKKQTVLFCAGLMITEIITITLYRRQFSQPEAQAATAGDMLMLVAVILGYTVWMVWYWHRAVREMAYLVPLVQEMQDDG